MNWKENILTDHVKIRHVLEECTAIAIIGIRPHALADKPAYFVPEYLKHRGKIIYPVAVHPVRDSEILGNPVCHKLTEVGEPIDMVILFRRSDDVPGHLQEILEVHPKVVWMQSGIQNEEVAERLAKEGILVVQNRCAKVDYANLVERNQTEI
jgi:predicted CoA-binding protein